MTSPENAEWKNNNAMNSNKPFLYLIKTASFPSWSAFPRRPWRLLHHAKRVWLIIHADPQQVRDRRDVCVPTTLVYTHRPGGDGVKPCACFSPVPHKHAAALIQFTWTNAWDFRDKKQSQQQPFSDDDDRMRSESTDLIPHTAVQQAFTVLLGFALKDWVRIQTSRVSL